MRFYGFSRTIVLCADIRTETVEHEILFTSALSHIGHIDNIGPKCWRGPICLHSHSKSRSGSIAQVPLNNALVLANLCKYRHNSLLTTNSSGDEIANVNFLYDDIVHVLQNTIDSCINSATDRRGYVLESMCLPNSVK